MQIYTRIENQWIERLKKGAILLHPTDTIWGLGGAAFSKTAFNKISAIKNRKAPQPMILLVHSLDQVKQYVHDIPPRVETLLHFIERPLTLIYPKVKMLPSHLLAENGSVAIRICKDPATQQIIQKIDQPLISTSANVKGTPFPKSYEEISKEIIGQSDIVFTPPPLDRFSPSNQPSVIAKFDGKGELDFIRT